MTIETYLALRERALSLRKEDLDAGTAALYRLWAVVMDAGLARGTATVVAVADGSSSLYLSSGGGYLGGGGNPSVRHAALACIAEAATRMSDMQRASDRALPGLGDTVFYVLTDSGVLTARASGQALAQGNHPLSKLFSHEQELINALARASTSPTVPHR
jgi:hypothetical protein